MTQKIPDFFESESQKEVVTKDSDLQDIKAFLDDAEVLKSRIEKGEALLKDLNTQLREIYENKIPELMQRNGINKLDVAGIGNVSVDVAYEPNLKKEDQEKFYQWLRDTGRSDIIKSVMVIDKAEDTLMTEIREKANELGLLVDEKEMIHWQTLKSFAKRVKESGEEVPEYFGIYKHYITKVKR